MKQVVLISATRTPIGSVGGTLSSLTAPQLGSIAIKAAIEKAGIQANDVQEVMMGNVLSAGLGQAPARQATLGAGLDQSTPCTTVNKVCASGMKAIMMASQSIMLGHADVVVAGGMESMSNVPYYLGKARTGYRLGHGELTDGIIKDGLWDVYKDFHMGMAGELCAKEMNVSRKDQDDFAVESYRRAGEAYKNDHFKTEICPVSITDRKGNVTVISEDEEYNKIKAEKIPTLRAAFQKDGTITAANASKLNDGAAAVVLMSKEKADGLGLKYIAIIKGFADAAQAPEWFTTAPSLAIPKAIQNAGIAQSDVDFFEINEAFSVVSIANNKKLNIDPAKVNILGGAVALGHPLGCSGARIVVTLCNVLNQQKGKIGVAGICNGGGGASAIVLERV